MSSGSDGPGRKMLLATFQRSRIRGGGGIGSGQLIHQVGNKAHRLGGGRRGNNKHKAPLNSTEEQQLQPALQPIQKRRSAAILDQAGAASQHGSQTASASSNNNKASSSLNTSLHSNSPAAAAWQQRMAHMLHGRAPPEYEKVEYQVQPAYDYPEQWMTARELHDEMMLPSDTFYDLRQLEDSSQGNAIRRSNNNMGTVDENSTELFQEAVQESAALKKDDEDTTTQSSNQNDPNHKSNHHPVAHNSIAHLRVEVLQCLGLPELDVLTDSDTVVYLVLGQCAFHTCIISDRANPQWLRKSKRACIFPVHHGYARLYVGVFDDDGENAKDDFAGRAVVDIARLRHGCEYDVILPLRLSTHVYTRRARGSVRLRLSLHLDQPERKLLTSYLPNPQTFKIVTPKKSKPNFDTTIACADATAFRNVALTVHGQDLPDKFSFVKVKALIKEIAFTMRFHMQGMRQELKDTYHWVNPFTSAYVFAAWMYCIYEASVGKLPAFLSIYLLIRLTRNYAIYVVQGSLEEGFLPPTGEEMLGSLVLGDNCIAPMELQHEDEDGELQKSTKMPHHTHHPALIWLFRLLGFIPWDHTKAPNLHLEFPFARGDVYPKFSLQESIADREEVRPDNSTIANEQEKDAENNVEEYLITQESAIDASSTVAGNTKEGTPVAEDDSAKTSSPASSDKGKDSTFSTPNLNKLKQMLFSETQAEFDDDDYDEDGINDLFGENDNYNPKNPMAGTTTPMDPSIPPAEVRKEQNLDWRPANKAPETLPQKLDRVSNKIHSITLHTFHDHSYTIKNPDARYFSDKLLIDTHRRNEKMKRRNRKDVSKKLDKLLGVKAHSTERPIIDRVGLLIEPMISAMYSGVCLFRSYFNIVAWQDPYHTFWFYLFVVVLSLVLLVIPWRPILFILGLVGVGPQNYLIRKLRDWKVLPPIKPKTPKVHAETIQPPSHVFHSHQRGDGFKPPKTPEPADPDEIHHIVVPYHRMMHQRFYDWPPEQEYATVTPVREKTFSSTVVGSLRKASTQTHRPTSHHFTRRRNPDRPRGQRMKKFLGRFRRKKKGSSSLDENASQFSVDDDDDGLVSVDGSVLSAYDQQSVISSNQQSVISSNSGQQQASETTSLLGSKS